MVFKLFLFILVIRQAFLNAFYLPGCPLISNYQLLDSTKCQLPTANSCLLTAKNELISLLVVCTERLAISGQDIQQLSYCLCIWINVSLIGINW